MPAKLFCVSWTCLSGSSPLSFSRRCSSVLRWSEPASVYLLAGSLFYLVGSILVTIVCNVPLNDRLAAVSPDSAVGHTLWSEYLSTWTRWNHVRTFASLLAALDFIVAAGLQWR